MGKVRKGKSARRGAVVTRAAILAAARSHFISQNYENVGLRDVARDAGIDVALIGRYFGSKKGLYEAVMLEAFAAGRSLLLDGARAAFGARVADEMLHGNSTTGIPGQILFLIRAATSPVGLRMMRTKGYNQAFKPFAKWLGGEDAEARARMISVTLFGAAVLRLTGNKTVRTKKARTQYGAHLGAALQTYVDGARKSKPRAIKKTKKR
jgi:AcrR family transcriptional regulator